MTEVGRRATILRAAEELVQHYGLRKTSIADIAERARIAVGSVYLEFESKNAILESLSASRHERMLASVEKALAGRGGHEVRLRRALDVRARAFLAYACESGEHEAELVHCACDGVKSAHARYRERELVLFAAAIAEGVAAGSLVSREPVTSARALLLAYESFAPPLVFARAATTATSNESDLSALHELALFGLVSKRIR